MSQWDKIAKFNKDRNHFIDSKQLIILNTPNSLDFARKMGNKSKDLLNCVQTYLKYSI